MIRRHFKMVRVIHLSDDRLHEYDVMMMITAIDSFITLKKMNSEKRFS